MPTVVDLANYKTNAAQRETLELIRRFPELPNVDWVLRRSARDFMREHQLALPDLLSIFATAFDVFPYVTPRTIVVTGLSADGEVFSLATVLSQKSFCLKVLKGWKGGQNNQRTA